MSTPTSPHGPVDRAQMLAVTSPEESFQYEFRDQLGHLDSGLTDTEREGERLAKKLKKRLSGDRNDHSAPSEYFIDKLTKWHSNKKVDKLKCLLAAHMPRVKHLEEDVVHSVASVHEHKEVVLHQAQLLLGLVDKQIDYYQHHLNFLDDVINDIRQCDYAVVKEVADMKTAFAFSQELDGRPRNNSRSGGAPHNPCTILLKIGTDSKGHVPGRRVLEDDAAVLERISPASTSKADVNEVLAEETVMVQLPRSVRREQLTPQKSFPGGDGSMSGSVAAAGFAPFSLPANLSAPLMESENKSALDTRDGSDYKRKCLKSGAVNLQLLNLQKIGISGNSPTASPPVYAESAAECKKVPSMSPSTFMRAVGDRLSELTQFQKPSPVQKKPAIEKHRSWSDSPRLGEAESDRAQFAKSVSLQDSMLSGGKNRASRSPSVGSMFFATSGGTESSVPHNAGKISSSTPAPLLHATTPRPYSTGHDAHHAPHPAHPHSIPVQPTAHAHMHAQGHPHAHPQAHAHDAHKVEGGIAFESTDHGSTGGPAHPQRTSSPPLHEPYGMGSKTHSFNGQLSTSSSCSSFSQASASHAGDFPGSGEKRRVKYSALLNHYPNLYQCVLSQASEPGVKLMARKLNKCLMFKDELKRSLVKAELVQETESSCLSKMRKVQHELQDMMEIDAAQNGSHASLASLASHASLLLKTPPTPSSPRQCARPMVSAGSGSSLLSAMSVENPAGALTGASSLGSDCTSVSGHSPGKLTVAHALLGRLSHASDHDLSSTDDEHDHLTASLETTSQSQSRDNSFTLHDAAAYSRPTSGASAPLEASSLIEPLERIPSDPTIIDSCQDAVVNQISGELFDVAHKCAQQLKILLDEEHEAVEKLQRVRQLLTTADFINEQLATTLSPK